MHSERCPSATGLINMDALAQYREFAERCRLLAAEAKSERHRRMLEEIADAWIKLAQERESENTETVSSLLSSSRRSSS